MIRDYFKKLDRRRAVIMIIGNIFTGMGISIFKLSGLGNDPFSGMVMAPVSYTHLTLPTIA